MDTSDALLALGRLDGRLAHSPAANAWALRARLHGAATSACNAGVPIEADHLEAWIAGTALPPRASEGRNDPLSVVAIVHYFFASLDAGRDGHARPVRRLLGALLDLDREAVLWAGTDLIEYGPLWRALTRLAAAPGLEPSLASVGVRLAEMARVAEKADGHAQLVASLPDGREILFAREHPKAWLVWLFVPDLVRRAGLTMHLLPSLVPRHTFLCVTGDEWTGTLNASLRALAPAAYRDLCRLERATADVQNRYRRTRRSRLVEAAELKLVLPSLTRKKLAIAVDATPAGAGYLLRQLSG